MRREKKQKKGRKDCGEDWEEEEGELATYIEEI